MRIRRQPRRADAELAPSAVDRQRPTPDQRLSGRPPGKRLCVVLPLTALLLTIISTACGGTNPFRPYEYEEEMYLWLDGSATMYVNTSVAALDALRGASFEVSPNARLDREAVRRFFSSPHTRVGPVRTSRRSGRRFLHVRLDVDDIRSLNRSQPFSWSTYRFEQAGHEFVFEQTIGVPAGRDVGPVGWKGRELVAFRVHLPSRINFHNTERDIGRGNILSWEQPLDDRLRGVPLTLQARIDTQSILYRTLWLFLATFVAVGVLFITVIWLVLRRGKAVQHAI